MKKENQEIKIMIEKKPTIIQMNTKPMTIEKISFKSINIEKLTMKTKTISKFKVEPIIIIKPNGITISKVADEALRNTIPTEINISTTVNRIFTEQINEAPIKEPDKQDIYFEIFQENTNSQEQSTKEATFIEGFIPNPDKPK
jgi:hypothetical protein